MLAGVAAAGILGALPAQAQTGPQEPPAPTPGQRLTLPLIYDGRYLGDIPVSILRSGEVRVWISHLVRLLGTRLSPDLARQINDASADPVSVDLAALNRLGVEASYDPATLELRVKVAIAQQGSNLIKVSDYGAQQQASRDFLKPSTFAASGTFYVNQRYLWSSGTGDPGFQPVRVTGDFAASLGGMNGVTLFSQHTYDGATRRFTRGNTQLVHDELGSQIRFTLGDVAPGATPLQSSPLLGGLSVKRAYGEIGPVRDIRSSGQMHFQLDRPATVDVVVNGTNVRTLQLQPGQYDLSNLPYFNGLNEVELYIQDESGRRLLATFSRFLTTTLLPAKQLNFDVSAGFLEATSGVGSRYKTSLPSASGYLRYGVNDNLTVGANFQVGNGLVAGGLEGTISTPVGAFSAQGSSSRHSRRGRGYAVILGYLGERKRLGPLRNLRYNLEYRITSKQFSTLGLVQSENRYRSQLLGRFAADVGQSFNAGLSYSRAIGRDFEPDVRQYSVQLRRRFGRFDVSASYDHIDSSGAARDRRFLATVTWRLGRSQELRGTYNGASRGVRVSYDRYQRDEIGSTGVHAEIERSGGSINALGELNYNANRFRGIVNHRLIADSQTGRITSQESSYTFSTQVAFAGGSMTIGRPVGPRFAIISQHPTMAGAQVAITDGAIRKHAQARGSRHRPALVLAGSAYLPARLRIDVDKLPAGYDIGTSEFDVQPGLASGYAIQIGSDASRIVIGSAVRADGSVAAMLGGVLIPLDNKGAAPVLVFTNRNGRFVISGLGPGRYELRLGAEGDLRTTITVPKKAPDGPVMVGKVTVDSTPPPGSPLASLTGQRK